MRYAPTIKFARVRSRYALGAYEAALLEHIVARGRIEYAFLFVVFETGSLEPCWFVSAEYQATEILVEAMKKLGIDPSETLEDAKKSAVLCTFDGDQHSNFGASSDWLNADLFAKRALSMFDERYGTEPSLTA